MDNFERKLKSLPLARPSRGLKNRIFGRTPGIGRFSGLFRQRITLGWAALFAVMTGLMGMYLARLGAVSPQAPRKAAVQIQIIRAASDKNVFDFTEPAVNFMPGRLTGTVETAEEI